MKKIVGIVSLLSVGLILAGCSTDKKADTLESSKSTNTSSIAKKEKKAEEKKAKEEAEKKAEEKKRQEEISKKVSEADSAMKAAEANPTDETIAVAKAAVEAIPGGNSELLKRLEAASTKLEVSKQQAAAQAAALEAQQAAERAQQQTPVTPTEQPQVTTDQQAEIDRQPTIETDENGRTYIFENHNAYKDEPYYTEDWKKYPSPYQDQ